MNYRLERWLDTALRISPAQPFFHWRAAHQLTILAYHGIDDPDRFQQQLDYLVQTMHPVTLDEVLHALNNRRGLPKRAVLITFDDGERSLVEVGLPLLRERGLPAVAFVVAGLLDTDQPYWWVEVKMLACAGAIAKDFSNMKPEELARALKKVNDEKRLAVISELRQNAPGSSPAQLQLRRQELAILESAGIMIGNHTLSHPCLTHCSEDKITAELSQAHEILTAALGHVPRSFAYPNGDADDRAARTLKSLGYEAAFLFDHRLSPIVPTDRFRLSRLRVNSDSHLDRFRIIVSGLHPALQQARGIA